MTKFWSGLERYILVVKFLVLIFGRSLNVDLGTT
jgi:hypothetical protein